MRRCPSASTAASSLPFPPSSLFLTFFRILLLLAYIVHPYLRSFPTRRSSDLHSPWLPVLPARSRLQPPGLPLARSPPATPSAPCILRKAIRLHSRYPTTS